MEMRDWPFLVGFEGRPWPESIDPFSLLLNHGDNAFLYVAVLMSLFSDARAPKDARLPIPDGDLRGWWADAWRLRTLFSGDARPKGSLLWLLSRNKDEAGNTAKIEQYARAALQWMIDAGLAAHVKVVAARGASGAVAVAIEVRNHAGGGILLKHPEFWKVYRAYKNQ